MTDARTSRTIGLLLLVLILAGAAAGIAPTWTGTTTLGPTGLSTWDIRADNLTADLLRSNVTWSPVIVANTSTTAGTFYVGTAVNFTDINLTRQAVDTLALGAGDRFRVTSVVDDANGVASTGMVGITDYRACSQCYSLDIKKEQLSTLPSTSRSALAVHNYQFSTGSYENVVAIDSITPATILRLRNGYNAAKATPGPGTGAFLFADATDANGYSTTKMSILSSGQIRTANAVGVYGNINNDTQPQSWLDWNSLDFGPGGTTALDVFIRRPSANLLELGTDDGWKIGDYTGTCTSATAGTTKYVDGTPGIFYGCRQSATPSTYEWAALS